MIEPLPIVSYSRRLALAALAALSALLVLNHTPGDAARITADSDRTAWVLMSPGSRSTSMSGSTDDLERARRLRAGQEGLLYMRRDGTEYVVRDPATLRQAQAIFAPQQALGARQGELGSRQAALGHRQAALGAQQGRIGAQMAGASPKRSAELGRRMEALGRQQNELGRQQNVLGREQDALGREQDRLSHIAEQRIRALLDEAIRRGVAQRVQ